MICSKFMTFYDCDFLLMLIVGYEGGWHVKCLRSWLYTCLFCPWFINQSSPNPCQYECDVSQVEWWKCLFTDGTSWRKCNSKQLLFSLISGSGKSISLLLVISCNYQIIWIYICCGKLRQTLSYRKRWCVVSFSWMCLLWCMWRSMFSKLNYTTRT